MDTQAVLDYASEARSAMIELVHELYIEHPDYAEAVACMERVKGLLERLELRANVPETTRYVEEEKYSRY